MGKEIGKTPLDLTDIFHAMTAATGSTNTALSFSGHEYFRHRLALSILSGRPVRIEKIRSADANPGLRGPSICPDDRGRTQPGLTFDGMNRLRSQSSKIT